MSTTNLSAANRAAEPVSAAEMEAVLRAALQPDFIAVQDDTAAHRGHAGHSGADFGTHFSLQIRAACFSGLSHVQRHRLVYDALRDLMPRGVHALAIKAEPTS
ncbi:MAG: BolA family transcriptional regulator [Proteobacteria bacterium]|uniref:BolA family protein n=1 Tax=Aquabacterium sp. TaxID=1872578 RepID=UPI0035C7610F|nr:BolA family transcriptional regulator [Pseudomonadota bacterium]